MSALAKVVEAVQALNREVEAQILKARTDRKAAATLLRRWRQIQERVPLVETPTGLKLPRLALPQTDEPGEIARFLFGEGLPGEFPFVNAAYREMYLEENPKSQIPNPKQTSNPKSQNQKSKIKNQKSEEPTRLFAGLGLAEDTNQRFHYLTRHQPSIRLSTAFDGPTLYGLDSDADGVSGKVGEGGVAIDTIEDMERLYAGFPLGDQHFSVSMTINGPAPILLAMYVAAARR